MVFICVMYHIVYN